VTATAQASNTHYRYFVSYSGVKLPLNLVTPLDAAALNNRNTFFRGWFDAERLMGCEKITYGEVELAHRYEYHNNGQLKQAVITNTDEEVTVMTFDEQGMLLSSACTDG
jgi:hypothetical protein